MKLGFAVETPRCWRSQNSGMIIHGEAHEEVEPTIKRIGCWQAAKLEGQTSKSFNTKHKTTGFHVFSAGFQSCFGPVFLIMPTFLLFGMVMYTI